ncbi:MAG: 16S rRNA (adenine(1518)-N(6)/adenine(1519)-N(6))-dimethyltransferase RsmA [Acidobacteriota bacterium]
MARHPSTGRRAGSSRPSRPRYDKRLGQHHLVDGKLCRPLVDYLALLANAALAARADVLPPPRRLEGRGVLEIGPGGGVLTRELLAAGARVDAWELDPAWALGPCRQLRNQWPQQLRLTVADALNIPWAHLPPGTLVAGNLPYNVATPLLRHLLRCWEQVPAGAFLVQWEVGERLVAAPGTSAYGALSVLVAARARARLLGRVKAGSFRPPPKVDGALVGLELMEPPRPEEEMPAFEKTVFLAFGQRRKTVRNALAAGWGKEGAREALEEASIDPGQRAERLALADFLRLHDARRRLSPVASKEEK